MPRHKERINCREPNDIKLPQRAPKLEICAVVPRNSRPTIYSEFKRHGLILHFSEDVEMDANDFTEWYPLSIYSFIKIYGERAIRVKIKTKYETAIVELAESDFIKEMYLGALASIYEECILKRWMPRNMMNKWKLPTYYDPKYLVGETAWVTIIVHCNHRNNCTCSEYQIVTQCTILEIDRHIFSGQLTPQFKIQVINRNLAHLCDGWVYTAQLSNECIEWKYLTISDILIEEMRHYVSIGYHKYTSSVLLTCETPMDLDITSAFYGKPELIQKDVNYDAIKNNHSSLFAGLATNTIKNIITRTNESVSVLNLLPITVQRAMTKSNVLKFGTYVDPILFDIGFKTLLNDFGIEIDFQLKKATFVLSLEKLDEMDISKVLQIHADGAETHICGDLTIEYVRHWSYICISKFRIIKKEEDILEAERNN